MAPQRRLTLVVVGLGRAGRIHLQNVLSAPRVRVKYCVDAAVEVTKAFLEEKDLNAGHDKCEVVTPDRLPEILKDPEIDAVFITAPTKLHYELIMLALNCGKPVFCEKPLTENLEQAERCYKLAAEKGLPLMCSLNRRFDPNLTEIHARKAEVGHIHTIRTIARDHPFPSLDYLKTSGGFFHDCGIHDFDLVSWIIGEHPVNVYVQAHTQHPVIESYGDVDTAFISFKWADGTLGSVELSRHACYGYDQRVELYGVSGLLQSEGQRESSVHYSHPNGMQQRPVLGSFPERYPASFKASALHFLAVVRGEEKLSVSSESVIRTMLLCDATAAAWKAKSPVSIDYANRKFTVNK